MQGAPSAQAVSIDELRIADDPERWLALGFAIADGVCQLGTVRVRLAGAETDRGIVGWSLRGIATGELDGLPTEPSRAPLPEPPAAHPNGASAIAHVAA